jgi:hypothetical protein
LTSVCARVDRIVVRRHGAIGQFGRLSVGDWARALANALGWALDDLDELEELEALAAAAFEPDQAPDELVATPSPPHDHDPAGPQSPDPVPSEEPDRVMGSDPEPAQHADPGPRDEPDTVMGSDPEPVQDPEPAQEPDPVPTMGPPPQPPGPSRGVDRAAAARELAGLFDDEEPRPKPAPRGSAEGDENGNRIRRVEDDDQVTRGLISRLIDGVKGL